MIKESKNTQWEGFLDWSKLIILQPKIPKTQPHIECGQASKMRRFIKTEQKRANRDTDIYNVKVMMKLYKK